MYKGTQVAKKTNTTLSHNSLVNKSFILIASRYSKVVGAAGEMQ